MDLRWGDSCQGPTDMSRVPTAPATYVPKQACSCPSHGLSNHFAPSVKAFAMTNQVLSNICWVNEQVNEQKEQKKPTTDFAFECPSWWMRRFAADSTVYRSVSWSTWDWAWVKRCEDICEHKLADREGGAQVFTPLLTSTLWRDPNSIQAWYTVHCLETEKIPQSLVSLRKLKSLCGWTRRGQDAEQGLWCAHWCWQLTVLMQTVSFLWPTVTSSNIYSIWLQISFISH